MLVTERMRSLGDHAKSSRQPPVKERKRAKADESAAEPNAVDESILENGAAHDSAAAVFVDDVTPQIVVHENGNGAVAEITSSEGAGEIAASTLVAVEIEPQRAAADDSVTQARPVQENDDISAAKRAIIHEWENWSALHSDELDDPNVAEYFFRHLETKKARLLDFISDNKQKTVFGLLLRNA
ncbi:MAG TPA: hypothetical protein VIG74_07410 [Alphaproteobacteria bacterium]